MSLGQNLKALRDAFGPSWGDLAAECNRRKSAGETETSATALHDLAKRGAKSSKFAGRIADYYGVPLELLLYGEPDILLSAHQSNKLKSAKSRAKTHLETRAPPTPEDWQRLGTSLSRVGIVGGLQDDVLLALKKLSLEQRDAHERWMTESGLRARRSTNRGG